MKKEVKTNVMRILEKEKVPYEARFYPHGKDAVDGVTVAELTGQNLDQVFKTLVTVSNKKEYFVFVIPVAKELDLKKAARAAGDKRVELLPLKELLPVTGYMRGGCSPIGMKKPFPTFIHESCILYDYIFVSAGVRGLQLKINPSALVKYVGAKECDLVLDK